MKLFFSVVLISFAFTFVILPRFSKVDSWKNFAAEISAAKFSLIGGCKKNMNDKPKITQITSEAAELKLTELSAGMESMYDDMKGFTVYRCRYNASERVAIVPYVLVYDDYSVSLRYHVLYSGREPLHFDTLYIKIDEGVRKFKYEKVSILSGYGNFFEEFNGAMSEEVYDALKKAVAEGRAKIRLEGRQMDERELKQNELDDFMRVFSIYEFLNSVKVEG